MSTDIVIRYNSVLNDFLLSKISASVLFANMFLKKKNPM